MKKQITIGSKKLSDLSADNLVDIAKIEGVHLYFQSWKEIIVSDFSNTLFSDTLVVDYAQKKIDNEDFERTIVFFFNFKNFCYHWHFKGENNTRESRRLSIESLKYLIDNGFDLPLY